MHDDDRPIDIATARALLAAQFPQWSDLSLIPATGGGTDNVFFRLGPDLCLRFPRKPFSAPLPAKEDRWLSVLAPALTLPLPQPVALGQPGLGYPWQWSVVRWLPGQDALSAPPDQMRAADALAAFLASLHTIPVPADAPPMPDSGHLAARDPFTRRMILSFTEDEGDVTHLLTLWNDCLALPRWSGRAVWVHADLHPLNLLSDGTALTGVIDWGALCAGDPAHDLAVAWYLLDPPARARFRDLLRPDPADWLRARAFAFSKAVQASPYYRSTNTPFRAAMQATLARVLADPDHVA